MLSLVINGVVVASNETANHYNPFFNIGQRYYQGSGHEWDGLIDNISIWNIALYEYSYNYLTGTEENLVSAYNINTDSQNELIDITDSGNNGNVYGAIWDSNPYGGISINSEENYNGSGIVTVNVAETNGEYQTSESFNVSVNTVNDAPSMVSVSDIVTSEETNTSVSLNATDIDGDTDFTFTASSSSDLFEVSVSGSELTIVPGIN